MILIDTCIWIWWVDGSADLPETHRNALEDPALDGIALSAISVWEVSLKHSKGKLTLSLPVREWVEAGTRQRNVLVVPLSPEIALDSTLLPGDFHGDPADRFIVATARQHDLPLMTADGKILAYPHVQIWTP